MIFAIFKTLIHLFVLFMVSFFGFGGMDGPFVTFTTDSGMFSVDVEIADDPDERILGLRDRPLLFPGHGMWFIFPDSQKRVFTMKNVLIPLDMVFVDESLTVTEIYANRQPALIDELTYSEFPASYVLELGGGSAAEFGLKPGTKLQFFP